MITNLAGDWFQNGLVTVRFGWNLKVKKILLPKGNWSYEYMPVDQVETIKLIDKEIGAFVEGVDAIVGPLSSRGRVDFQTVLITFKDGRKALVRGDRKNLAPILRLPAYGNGLLAKALAT